MTLLNLISFSLLPFLFHAASSQFVPPPTDLIQTSGYLNYSVRYKEVPDGICETTPGVKSYSGYVDIAKNQHIFWWLFEARNQDPTTAPLTIWINGGPGSSSMLGLFAENGPCGVNDKIETYYNPYSWNNVSNVVYIDHPAQVGFSYSIPIPGYTGVSGDVVQLSEPECPKGYSGCATYSYPSVEDTVNTTKLAAVSMWKTLQGLTGALPQYAKNGIHFTTESYGGHYAPVFNEYFETQNALIDAGKLPGAHKLKIESVMIGNGWYDPLIQYAAYYNFTVYPGNTYDYSPFDKRVQEKMYLGMYGKGNCYDMTVQCYATGRDDVCSASDDFCYGEVEFILDHYAHRNEYDIRELNPDPFPYEFFVEYLNKPKVQKALGAYVNYSAYNDIVGTSAFGNTGDDDRTQGSVAAVKKLVEQGVYVVQYNGDADYNCNWLGNQAVTDEINPIGWSGAGYINVTTSDGIVHGQVKQSSNFAFARVYESGHEVPFYQPLISLEMLERTLNGTDIATGQVQTSLGSGYQTGGTRESKYREGNSTVQFKVLKPDATYNTTTNEPNPPKKSSSGQSQRRKRAFKPTPKHRFGMMRDVAFQV